MLCLGIWSSLRVLRKTAFGAFLGEVDGDEDVLLPKKYVPKGLDVDDLIDVFLYTDSEDRIVATTLTPKLLLRECAVLEVNDVTKFGAFLDWGLEKDLFFPFAEQEKRVRKGDKVLVCLCLDERKDRLFASAKINEFMEREITVKEGEEVDLLIGRKSELGYQVVINNCHLGLIFSNQVFQPLRMGDKVRGFIGNIREDGKIDVTLRKQGYAKIVDAQEVLLQKLQESGGVLHLTDKSDPKLIAQKLGFSKRMFKDCVGALYKQNKIKIEADCIVLL